MYKITSEEVYKKCPYCKNRKLIKKEVKDHYCDECGKKMKDYLEFTVYNLPKTGLKTRTKRYECCTWRCVFEKLLKVRSNYFIDLPLLLCDDKTPINCRAKLFLTFIKRMLEPQTGHGDKI